MFSRIGIARGGVIRECPTQRTITGIENGYLYLGVNGCPTGYHAGVVGEPTLMQVRASNLIIRPEIDGAPIMVAEPSGDVRPYEEPIAFAGGNLAVQLVGGDLANNERVRIMFSVLTQQGSHGRMNVAVAQGALPAGFAGPVVDIDGQGLITRAKAMAVAKPPVPAGGMAIGPI